MRSAKARVIVSLFVFMFGVAVGAGYCEETSGAATDTQSAAVPAVDASMPAATPAPEAAAAPEAAPVPETAIPAAPEAAAPEAPDAYMAPAAVAEQPVATPAVIPAVEVKKEEPKPVESLEKPKKEKKVSKLPDLEIVKVVTKKAGATDVELVVFVKNKGAKSAKAKEREPISLAVRLEGETATRVVKIGDVVKAGKKIECSLGTYPKEKIDGKKIFVMVTYDGKEANKQNNVWDKPAKLGSADRSPKGCKPAKRCKK